MALVDLVNDGLQPTRSHKRKPMFSNVFFTICSTHYSWCSYIADNRRYVGVKLLVQDVPISKSRKLHFLVVYVLLGISPASNFSWPTFRNPVSVPSSKAGCRVAFKDGTDTGFRNVGQLQFDAGEIPQRTYTMVEY